MRSNPTAMIIVVKPILLVLISILVFLFLITISTLYLSKATQWETVFTGAREYLVQDVMLGNLVRKCKV